MFLTRSGSEDSSQKTSKCVCFFIMLVINMYKYMNIAIKEAEKAFKEGEIPVGAIIVKDDKIISKAYNKKESKNNPIAHAEIIAISKACKKLKTWHLDDCTMYVTMEPCLMCAGAMIQSRIKKVVYGVENKKFGFVGSIDNILNNKNMNHTVEIEKNLCEEEISNMLKKFFKDKRS